MQENIIALYGTPSHKYNQEVIECLRTTVEHLKE